MHRTQAPGLRWRKLASGHIPAWFADREVVRAGFLPERVDLGHLADQPDMLKARCAVLQSEMRLWLTGHRHDPVLYDGTIRSLLSIYVSHPKSTLRRTKPSTQRSYQSSLRRLTSLVGERHVASITGLDLMQWSDEWSANGGKPAAAGAMRTVLLAAAVFGQALRLDDCAELVGVIRAARGVFPGRRPREVVISAEQVVAVRRAAHEAGRPSRALAYAVVYEATLRLFDVIGQDWPGGNGMIWRGLRWEDVDDDLVLRYRPSKTEDTSGAVIVYPLRMAPMVVEELRHWPLKRRAGPMIVDEATGEPYRPSTFQDGWRRDRKIGGLPKNYWARDLRASGITEARAAGIATDDAAKVAGHAGTRTTAAVYDRAALEAAERFAEGRRRIRQT